MNLKAIITSITTAVFIALLAGCSSSPDCGTILIGSASCGAVMGSGSAIANQTANIKALKK